MKSTFIAIAIFILPLASMAQAQEASYSCTPTAGTATQFSAGADEGNIHEVKALKVEQTSAGIKAALTVTGIKTVDSSTTTTPTESVLNFTMQRPVHGMMIELIGAEENNFEFDAAFLEFGNIDVLTAGPIPPGTYDAKLAVGIVDSNLYYKNAYPMTVKKLDFNCQATFK